MLESKVDEIKRKETEIVDEKEYEQIRNKYQIKVMTPRMHMVVVGEAARLVDTIANHGGTEEEVTKAIYYLRICEDTYEYNLDHIRYREENGIDKLARKYGITFWKWKRSI